jgi:hypothetical protein
LILHRPEAHVCPAICRSDGRSHAKKFKPVSRQRSNFATSSAAASRECVEEIKERFLILDYYVATDSASEADEYRAVH